MNAGSKAGCGLVVPGCDRPERLDCGEDSLDPVSFPVGVLVKGSLKRAVFLRGKRRRRSAFCECIQQPVQVTGRVADQWREDNVVQKIGHRHAIMARTGQNNTADQPSSPLLKRVDPCDDSTLSRVSHRLFPGDCRE